MLKEKGQHGDFNPDGGGADVILATSNSYKGTADAIKGIRTDGRVILMGFSTTESLTVPPEILLKRIYIIGSTQNNREHLYETLDYVAKGKVRVMTEILPLEFYVLAMIVFLVFSSNDLFGCTDLQRISDMFVLRHIINETLITNND